MCALFKQPAASTAEKRKNSGSPYLNGREEWLERYGSYISRAAQWRMVAFLCLIITAVSITGNVIQASQTKTIPYIIEVDALGKAAVAARADTASATPKRLIQAEIAKCVSDWRTVTADVELQQKMIERLSFFMAGSAKGVLRQWYELHLAHIKGLPGCQRTTDQGFRLFPRGRVIGFPGNIDRQGIQPGFLPGNGFHQWRGRLRLRCECGRVQTKQNGQRECLFHGVYASCLCVERNANKPPRRAGREWSRRR